MLEAVSVEVLGEVTIGGRGHLLEVVSLEVLGEVTRRSGKLAGSSES